MRRSALACLALMLLAVSVRAQDELVDYGVTSDAWNGLSSFAAVAEYAGARVSGVDVVDLGEMGSSDVLVLVHPTRELDDEALLAWVRGGGRLLVADDIGSSDRLARAFGLTRGGFDARHRPALQDNRALPILSPVGEHRLSEGVRTVVANHPATLRGDGLPVFAFDDGAGLLFDLSLGEGTAVFLSDPSTLINLMLPIGDNAVMARNMVTYLCEDVDGCRLVVAREVEGEAGGGGLEAGGVDDLARTVAHAAQRFRAAGVDPRALYWASLLLLVGLGIVAATIFPQAVPDAGRSPVPAPAQQPASEFELSVRRQVAGQRGGSFMMPAALLRESFDATFWRALGRPRPEAGDAGDRARRQAAEEWVRRFAATDGRRARERRVREVEKTLRTIADLPRRGAVMASMHAWLGPKELVTLYADAMTLLEAMEKDGDYRRRAQRPR